MTSPEKEPCVWSLSTIKPVDVNLELDEVKRKKALFYNGVVAFYRNGTYNGVCR